MFSPYTVLGIDERASDEEVAASFHLLCERLSAHQFEAGTLGHVQMQQCRLGIEEAFKTLSDPEAKAQFERQWAAYLEKLSTGESQPKLGQLCVASGMITLDDLQEAIKRQEQIDLPIGQILQQQKLISQAELDGLLIGQQLIRLPLDSPYSIGHRLLALGLVTEDMVRIALIERRTFDRELADILVEHGWLDRTILAILMEAQPESSTGKEAIAN